MIKKVIGQARFKLVEVQIAAILQLEFTSQNNMQSEFLYPEKVHFSRYGMVNECELPFVSVNWMQEENSAESRASLQYSDSYFIDVKCVNRSDAARVLNAIRHILKSNEYYNLALQAGIVNRTEVSSLGLDFEERTRGVQGTASGGVNFKVGINEDVSLLEGEPFSSIFTRAIIGENSIEFIGELNNN